MRDIDRERERKFLVSIASVTQVHDLSGVRAARILRRGRSKEESLATARDVAATG
jgi:hypothetical protein